MKSKKPLKTCAHGPCLLKPTDGTYCWYHTKVVAGLCEPDVAKTYDPKVIVAAGHKEMARLRAMLGGAT